MGRIQLIYHSESGFTERYATWLSEDFETDCVQLDKSMGISVGNSDDILVIGAPVHGGKIARTREIKHLIARAGKAKVACFATGVAEPVDGLAERIAQSSFGQKASIVMRYLPGGFDGERLSQQSEALLKALRLMLKHRRNLTSEQQMLLTRTAQKADFTDRTLARELAFELRGLSA